MSLTRGERAKLTFLRKQIKVANNRLARAQETRAKKIEAADLPIQQIEKELQAMMTEAAPLEAKATAEVEAP